jgi:hypothetical protein
MSDWQDGQGTMSDWQGPEDEEDAPAPSRMEARTAAKRARTRRLHIALGTLAVAVVAGGGPFWAGRLSAPVPPPPASR